MNITWATLQSWERFPICPVILYTLHIHSFTLLESFKEHSLSSFYWLVFTGEHEYDNRSTMNESWGTFRYANATPAEILNHASRNRNDDRKSYSKEEANVKAMKTVAKQVRNIFLKWSTTKIFNFIRFQKNENFVIYRYLN